MPNKLLFNWSTYQERDREGGINNEEKRMNRQKEKCQKEKTRGTNKEKKTKNEKSLFFTLAKSRPLDGLM